MDKHFYVLSPLYGFRGWKLLPYAVQCIHSSETEFFDKHGWNLIKASDGKTPGESKYSVKTRCPKCGAFGWLH